MKPVEPIYRMFGLKVQQIREMLGVTQQELGIRTGLTRTSINNIEHGRTKRTLDHQGLYGETWCEVLIALAELEKP